MEGSNKGWNLLQEDGQSSQTIISTIRIMMPQVNLHCRLDLWSNRLTRDDSNKRTGELNDIRLDGGFARPDDQISDTIGSLFPLFLCSIEDTSQQDGYDTLDTLGPRETSDCTTRRASTIDCPSQRDDQVFQLVLVDRFDKMFESLPCSSDDFLRGIIEQRDKDPDPVDSVIGSVALVDLTHGGKDVQSRGPPQWRWVLRPILSVSGRHASA